jgi:hypothetical protein
LSCSGISRPRETASRNSSPGDADTRRPDFSSRTAGLRLAASHVFTYGGLGVLPVVLFLLILVYSGGKGFGFDFHAFWTAGRAVLDGQSPYPLPTAAALKHEDQFVYPPLAALLFVPFALLPYHVAAVLFASVLFACVPLTLRLLGVRDWRCYGAAFLWIPVIDCIRLGAVSLLLALGTAVLWRYRNSRAAAPLALAFLITVKIFLWPLVIWLLVQRRVRSAVATVTLAAALTAGAWAVIGFAGLRQYPALLGQLTHLLAWKSYSVSALAVAGGLNAQQAQLCGFVVGAVLLAGIAVVARNRGGDRAGFILAIGAAFAFSPIVWEHYYVVLLVVLAITRPRLSPLWFVPLAFWFALNQSHGNVLKILTGLAVLAGVLFFTVRESRLKPKPGLAEPAVQPAPA